MSNIFEVDILDESKDCFLTYAEEVLTDRAIPAAEDGLLSAQRKILWTMSDYLKMSEKGKTKKCNAIVGSTLATSYYHGDAACYGVLCKMSQEFLMRYPLIVGQGSLGTQEDNSMVASSRYCMTGDTLIPTDKGTIQLGEIVKNSEESEEYKIDLNVLGYDGKIHHASKLFNSGKYPTIKITLQNGMSVNVTENHPLMVLDENLNFSWKLAEKIKPEDKILILVPSESPFSKGRNDYLEAAMLGAMISEGYATTQNRIGINNQNIEMIEPVVEYIHREVPSCKANICKNINREYYEFCFADQYFYPQFVKEFEFERSLNKHLPKQYFEGDLKYKATVLRYLFEGDGSVDIEHGISYSSISELLIKQLQITLLQDFGIVSSILRAKTRNEIKLRINNVYAERFKNKINFVSERKKEFLNGLITKYNEQKVIANGNICNIYEITDYIRKKYTNRFFTHNGFSNKKSYSKLKERISKEDFDKVQNLIENYVNLKVTSVESSGINTVYSLKIDDESHAYIGNGFINHNTEAKPSKYADLMMIDYKKNPVPTKETYNGEFMEPVVLPALFPNAICNGRQAIGVSMAHNSPSHNLTEVCNAIIAYIHNKQLTIDELLEIMPGPDFPLGGTIINKKDIKQAFASGKSDVSLKIRGDYEIKDNKIIFTTIPYRTYRKKIKEQLEKNVEKLEDVLEDFDDESAQGKNKLVFYAKKGVDLAVLVKRLFQCTDLQTTLSYNMNFIVHGTPKLCSMLDLIQAYIEHQHNVLKNIAIYDKDKAAQRVHIIEGLLVALEDIDKAIQLIKNSANKTEAMQALLKAFSITSAQAEAILDMKLVRLTKLNRNDLLDELKTKRQIVIDCDNILNNASYRDEILEQKILQLRDTYGDARRTQIIQMEDDSKEGIKPQDCVVTLTQGGTIRRTSADTFQPQRRGSKGTKIKNDAIISAIHTNTIDYLLVFTNLGKMYRLLVNNIPDVEKGVRLASLIQFDSQELPILIYSQRENNQSKYIYFITKQGTIKKTLLSEYTETKRGAKGIIALKLREGDTLISVFLANEEELFLATKQGQGMRITTNDINPIGRATIGIHGIKLTDNDEVVYGGPIRNNIDDIGIFTIGGMGKRIKVNDIPLYAKGAKGVKCTANDQTIAAVAMLEDDDTILVSGDSNICITAKDIPTLGRAAMGVIIIGTKKINSVTKI